MKVIHCTETLLILEDRPWFLGISLIAMALAFIFGGLAMVGEGMLLGGASFALFGGGVPITIAALIVRRVQLTLDRSTGDVTRTVRSVQGLSRETQALRRVIRADLGTNTDSDGTTYRTELHLVDPPQVMPFTRYYTSGKKPEVMTRAVNDWLAASPQTARR